MVLQSWWTISPAPVSLIEDGRPTPPGDPCPRLEGHSLARLLGDLGGSYPVDLRWGRLLRPAGCLPGDCHDRVALRALCRHQHDQGPPVPSRRHFAWRRAGAYRRADLADRTQGSDTLSVAFLVGFLVALWCANSGVAALFDALNVVYGEKEKRSLLRFYATTFLLTLGMIARLGRLP
jgi:hypothetical protein